MKHKKYLALAGIGLSVFLSACGASGTGSSGKQSFSASLLEEEEGIASSLSQSSDTEDVLTASAEQETGSLSAFLPGGDTAPAVQDPEDPEYFLLEEMASEDGVIVMPGDGPPVQEGVQPDDRSSDNSSSGGSKGGSSGQDKGNSAPAERKEDGQEAPPVQEQSMAEVPVEETTVPLTSPEAAAAQPAVGTRPSTGRMLLPSAPGAAVFGGGVATLDASNTSQGYVMLRYDGSNPKVKFQIGTPAGTTYTYDVKQRGSFVAFPLSAGSGNYTFQLYESISVEQSRYSLALSAAAGAALASEYVPFLYPNHYTWYGAGSACVAGAQGLAAGCSTDLQVVDAVYRYVVGNTRYDDAKAATVPSGYAPNPDSTLASHTGICFDYASLMCAMLRSQGIPCRLEVGYVGSIYHAWVSAHVDDIGWVDGVISFNGTKWVLMDPTMASGNTSQYAESLKRSPGYQIKYIY